MPGDKRTRQQSRAPKLPCRLSDGGRWPRSSGLIPTFTAGSLRSLLDQALVTGTPEEIELHGAALCRGYAKAIQVLEVAAEPDDAYMLGQDMRSGFRVAIGRRKAVAQRVREVHGETVVWITPDEVATIVANLEAIRPIAAIKRLFPGAEMLDVHAGEPAK
jgi:hypothetical protein